MPGFGPSRSLPRAARRTRPYTPVRIAFRVVWAFVRRTIGLGVI